MSTLTHAFASITSFTSLLQGYKAVIRGKHTNKNAAYIDCHLASTLLELQSALRSQTYRPLPYSSRYIYEPKRRFIQAPAFRDRIVHHAICSILIPFYERYFIKDSYACRSNKGTHQALDAIQHILRTHHKETLYVCKIDISKYFASINHGRLKELLATKIADKKLLRLLNVIIDSTDSGVENDSLFPPGSPYHTKGRRGIPIGNLTSQLFANIYLHHADMYAKQQLKIRLYIRYMDDILLFHTDKAKLAAWKDSFLNFLYDDLYLAANSHKVRLYPTRCGVDFVGYVISPYSARLRSSSVRRFKRKYRRKLGAVAAGRLSADELQNLFSSWEAHARYVNATGLIASLKSWQTEAIEPIQLSLFGDNWDNVGNGVS